MVSTLPCGGVESAVSESGAGAARMRGDSGTLAPGESGISLGEIQPDVSRLE